MARNLEYYLSLHYDIKLQLISEEDGGGWLARIEELEGCIADGETPDEAVNNIKGAKKDWIQFCLDKGMDIPEPRENEIDAYSGRFTLRVGKTIHGQLTKEADREGVSVNSLVNNYIVMGLQNTSITNALSNILNEKFKPNINVLIKPNSKPFSMNRIKTTEHWSPWDKRSSSMELFHP